MVVSKSWKLSQNPSKIDMEIEKSIRKSKNIIRISFSEKMKNFDFSIWRFIKKIQLQRLAVPLKGVAPYVGVWKRFFGNFRFWIGYNFGAKCPFLIVLGLFESLDIDLYNATGPIKKYFLSSEIQLLKVGHISKNVGKSQILRQPYKEILCNH